MGTLKVNGDISATGNVSCIKTGARCLVNNNALELWFGINTDGTAWGIYNNTDGAYIVKQTSSATTFYGNASTATKLATARTIRTNLASTSTASFDGSANITPGVTGTLAVGNGGTGKTSFTAGYVILGNGSSALKTTNAHINYSAGTTSAAGYEELVLGNSTESGTAGNTYGRLALYSSSSAGVYLTAAATTGWSYTSILPLANGTLLNTGNYSSYALPLSGGTITGSVTFSKSNNYYDIATGTGGSILLNNGDIAGVNSIYFKDAANSVGEGLMFYRSATTVDSLRAYNGVLYFSPNYDSAAGTQDGNYTVVHSGNYTNYQVNTDTKVQQSRSTSTNWRPLLSHYTATTQGTNPEAATNVVYYNEKASIQPSTGKIYSAGGFIGNASTATKLATARKISLTGSVTGSGNFDGSGNLSIATTTNHTHSYVPLSGGTMTGTLSIKGSGSNRATLEVFSSSNIPCALWLGSNNLTKWSITCRASDENYMLGLYNKDNNYSLHIKPTGEIIFDKPGYQYGSSYPSSPTKGQIFFKT